MNIGDGLTLQSRTIDGKTTSGIFFLPSKSHKSHKPVPKSVKKTVYNNLKLNDEATKVARQKPIQDQVRTKKVETANPQTNKLIKSKSSSDDVIFIDNNTRVTVEEKAAKDSAANPVASDEPKLRKKKDSTLSKDKKNSPKQDLKNFKSREKLKQVTKGKNMAPNEIKVDTNFVTLTQDQLNTILNLVKTKQEIDVASVINKENKVSRANTSEKKKSLDEKKVEPTSIPGLDLDNDSPKPNENKTDSDKENVSKLLEKVKDSGGGDGKSVLRSRPSSQPKSECRDDPSKHVAQKKELTVAELSGTLGGYGSRDREKSRLEERRKKWIADLNEQVEHKKQLQQTFKRSSVKTEGLKSSSADLTPADKSDQSSSVRSAPSSASRQRKDESICSNSSTQVEHIHESLPTAIRSSFFLGEAAPRDHAFSAKKRQEQQAWREELDKQVKEREKMKHQASTKETEETDAWSRHFETMIPVQSKPQQLEKIPSQTDSNPGLQAETSPQKTESNHVTQTVTSPQKQSPRNPAFNSDNISGIYLGEHTSNPSGPRVQSNYLRSMTALLDPSQIDAMELKRQKQLEHRRVIAEQVEEKRRLKEAQIRAKKLEEELEEKRLEEERRKLKYQFEKEKSKQQAMEEKRDRQTQELYQQMKEAEASALKEKFERRQQNLRSHGHDTSRLERTHQHALEKNMPPLHRLSPPPLDHVPSLDIEAIASHRELQVSDSPRVGIPAHPSSEQAPMTVMTGSGPVPIKLEISLNHKQGDVVARAVQTDDIVVGKKAKKKNETLLEILSDSDTETQYMELPYPSARKNVQKSRKVKQPDEEQEARNRHYDRYSRTNKYEDDVRREKDRKGPKPKWGVGPNKKQYVPASNRYVSSKREKEEREDRLRRRKEQLLTEQARNQPDKLISVAASKVKVDEHPDLDTVENYRPRRKERSHSPDQPASYRSRKPNRNRSSSPPVPALQNQMRTGRNYSPEFGSRSTRDKPDTAISVTTEQAKYKSSKHSPNSPVPDTDDFVEYRRSDVILDPNQPQTRPNTETKERNYSENPSNLVQTQQTAERSKDPLLNADMLKQKERQERILKEISILRQGLLLKQREVASYPVAVSMPNVGKNLPERTNDVNMT